MWNQIGIKWTLAQKLLLTFICKSFCGQCSWSQGDRKPCWSPGRNVAFLFAPSGCEKKGNTCGHANADLPLSAPSNTWYLHFRQKMRKLNSQHRETMITERTCIAPLLKPRQVALLNATKGTSRPSLHNPLMHILIFPGFSDLFSRKENLYIPLERRCSIFTAPTSPLGVLLIPEVPAASPTSKIRMSVIRMRHQDCKLPGDRSTEPTLRITVLSTLSVSLHDTVTVHPDTCSGQGS